MSQKNSFLTQIWPHLNTSIKSVAYLMHHLACHQWSKLQTKFTMLDYSGKNPNRWVEDILFRKPALKLLDLSLYPKKFQRKQAFTPGNSAKLCDTPRKFQVQKPRPLETIWFFLVHSWKFHFFLDWPLEFPHVLSWIPLEIPCPGRPCFDFFWNSPFWRVLDKKYQKAA